jgi:hypothetical protein
MTLLEGMTLTAKGYLRIKRRGPLRDQMAHRAYVNRQMQRTYGRDLRPDEEVHHLCKNRACWPCTDFHLVVMDSVIHHAIDGGSRNHYRKGAKNNGH